MAYYLSLISTTSINDFIDKSLYSLSYCTKDNAYRIIYTLGPGALMSKVDFKNAFHIIPVRPKDCNLLQIYADTCLPFGLMSAPYIFNELSTAIHWILQHTPTIWLISSLVDLLTLQYVNRTCKLCLHYATRSMHPSRCQKWKALPPH